jgi:membrane associated rhomboid family serine protease
MNRAQGAGGEKMNIDANLKLVIGTVFAVVGAAVLFIDRSSRGFGQRRQMGVILVLGGIFVIAVARGLIRL